MKKFIERFLKWLIYKKWKKKVKNIYKKTEMEIKDSKFQKVKEKYPKKWNIWFHFPEKILEKNREYDSFSKELENAQKITKEEEIFLKEETEKRFKEKWGEVYFCNALSCGFKSPGPKEDDHRKPKELILCSSCNKLFCEKHKLHHTGHETLILYKQRKIREL